MDSKWQRDFTHFPSCVFPRGISWTWSKHSILPVVMPRSTPPPVLACTAHDSLGSTTESSRGAWTPTAARWFIMTASVHPATGPASVHTAAMLCRHELANAAESCLSLVRVLSSFNFFTLLILLSDTPLVRRKYKSNPWGCEIYQYVGGANSELMRFCDFTVLRILYMLLSKLKIPN